MPLEVAALASGLDWSVRHQQLLWLSVRHHFFGLRLRRLRLLHLLDCLELFHRVTADTLERIVQRIISLIRLLL